MSRHATDVISLVFGLLFGGIAVVWALHATGAIDGNHLWIAGPAILIAAGVAGLAATFRSSDSP